MLLVQVLLEQILSEQVRTRTVRTNIVKTNVVRINVLRSKFAPIINGGPLFCPYFVLPGWSLTLFSI